MYVIFCMSLSPLASHDAIAHSHVCDVIPIMLVALIKNNFSAGRYARPTIYYYWPTITFSQTPVSAAPHPTRQFESKAAYFVALFTITSPLPHFLHPSSLSFLFFLSFSFQFHLSFCRVLHIFFLNSNRQMGNLKVFELHLDSNGLPLTAGKVCLICVNLVDHFSSLTVRPASFSIRTLRIAVRVARRKCCLSQWQIPHQLSIRRVYSSSLTRSHSIIDKTSNDPSSMRFRSIP